MNLWAKKFLPILTTTLLVVFLSKTSVFAHPGRTASDGCHYCRTRCDYWGVPWNARHCHGGTISPTPTKRPTPTPTTKPELSPTPTPAVLGSNSQETQYTDSFWNLTALAVIGGLGWLGYKLGKKLI